MKLKLLPYKLGSKSAKELALLLSQKLGYKVWRVHPNYVKFNQEFVVNWGCSERTAIVSLNQPLSVAVATDKKQALTLLKDRGISVPDFTTEMEVAKKWIIEDGARIVCRRILNGHGGMGITLAETADELIPAKLYTKHVKHKTEYRVHVMNGTIIDAQKKMKRNGVEVNNPYIRNYENGWIFAREGVQLPLDVENQSVNAVAALGLDFGAVDIGYREKEGKAFVFEVNTAPGLEGTTLTRYVEGLVSYLGR